MKCVYVSFRNCQFTPLLWRVTTVTCFHCAVLCSHSCRRHDCVCTTVEEKKKNCRGKKKTLTRQLHLACTGQSTLIRLERVQKTWRRLLHAPILSRCRSCLSPLPLPCQQHQHHHLQITNLKASKPARYRSGVSGGVLAFGEENICRASDVTHLWSVSVFTHTHSSLIYLLSVCERHRRRSCIDPSYGIPLESPDFSSVLRRQCYFLSCLTFFCFVLLRIVLH